MSGMGLDLASLRTASASCRARWMMDSLEERRRSRASRAEISWVRLWRVVVRAVCCALRAGRAERLAAWREWIREVRAAEMLVRRASFWGLGGMGGGGAFWTGLAAGRGVSNGEVRRSGRGALG